MTDIYRMFFISCGLLSALVLVPCRGNAADFAPLLSRIPATANALIVMDVEAIFGSELAKREKWRATYADRFAAAPLIIPPKAQRFVMGAELDIQSMTPRWEVASMQLSVDRTLPEIAKTLGGAQDRLAGVDTLWLRKDFCLARFGPGELAALSPSNRQDASRWLASVASDATPNLSKYLQCASEYASRSGPEMIMAIDLYDVVRPEDIRLAVQRADVLSKLNQGEAITVLSSVEGIMLGVRVTDRIVGKLVVDFAEDATVLQDVVKPLLLKILANGGAMLDEFGNWSSGSDSRRIWMEGPLSTDSLRRLFSLLSLDTAILAPASSETASPQAASQDSASMETTEDPTYKATLRYFRAVLRHFDDIDRTSGRRRSLDTQALWINNYARKIDRLPTGNVDPDMVDYGRWVAEGLRQVVATLHGVGQRVQELEDKNPPASQLTFGALPSWQGYNYGNQYYQSFYRPFAVGQIDIAGALAKRREYYTEETQSASEDAQKIFDDIRDTTEKTRSQMVERYGKAFAE